MADEIIVTVEGVEVRVRPRRALQTLTEVPNVFDEFTTECIEFGPSTDRNYRTHANDVFSRFKSWAYTNGLWVPNRVSDIAHGLDKSFGERANRYQTRLEGYDKMVRVYNGIRLITL